MNGHTIRDHSAIVAREGEALMGKFGTAIGAEFQASLNEQIAAGTPTYLYLTSRDGWNGEYVTHRCQLRGVLRTPTRDQMQLVPSYYRGSAAEDVRTWFRIGAIVRVLDEEMAQLYVASSGRPISSVIFASATVFHVALRPRELTPSPPRRRH